MEIERGKGEKVEMKTNPELKETANLMIEKITDDGGYGKIMFGKLKASVIWSYGAGWEHVSVTPMKKQIIPSWNEMCKVKSMFFYPNETVIQYHPSEKQYVNNLENCLHLWRPQNIAIPLPPPILIGIPEGMSKKQIEEEMKKAYQNPYALLDRE